MSKVEWRVKSAWLVLACISLAGCGPTNLEADKDADIIVVGAGLAGLSAAIEAASAGARVLVLDMNSVFGGHGIQSGGVAVVGSPMQAEMGYQDTPDLAYEDWMQWTVDGHPEWTRYYVENSREQIYDWVTGFGVRFDRVIPSHGNSVPRFHMTYRRGLNLVRPLYLEALRYSNIRFRWNAVVQNLSVSDGRVAGVTAMDLRQGTRTELTAHSVILATGGFQSNIGMVKRHWRADMPVPETIFSMSGQFSRGSGHGIAEAAGAALVHMDRQYNGYAALPNVLGLDTDRGFVSGSNQVIWVNDDGERFVTETGIDRDVFAAVMREAPNGYWRIFDDNASDTFRVNSPHFVSAEAVDLEKIRRLVVDNPDVTIKANTLEELARRTGLPATALLATVERYNQQVHRGEDTAVNGLRPEAPPPVFSIDTPPFYAMRVYPMANKSAGGVSIDLAARALNGDGQPVPGLYAAGELTGSAGINGLNGLDGMFTGPAILTGRVAGGSAVADLASSPGWTSATFAREEIAVPDLAEAGAWRPELGADDLALMLEVARDGFWHFERVHHLVLERAYACEQCHSQSLPFAAATTRVQRRLQADTCDACHLAPAGTLDPTANQASAEAP